MKLAIISLSKTCHCLHSCVTFVGQEFVLDVIQFVCIVICHMYFLMGCFQFIRKVGMYFSLKVLLQVRRQGQRPSLLKVATSTVV